MKKVLSVIVIAVGICVISTTGSGCKNHNQNQANDSVASESPTDESPTDKLSQFREKFTIENVLNLVANPQSKSAAQKCGLEFIYKDSLKEEGYEEGQYFTYYQYAYGYDINKGKRNDNYMGYDLKSVSEHACYFIYSEGQDTDYRLFFKSKADADYFFDIAKKNGFKKGNYDYSNGKYEMRSPEADNGWYRIYVMPSLSSYDVSEENDEINNSNNGLSESNKQKTLEYMSELQQIANEIDNVYNQYVRLVSSGNLDPMAHGNLEIKATQNISKLRSQAESIWNKLIALARETGGDVRALQEEKKKYLGDAYKMQLSLHSVGMNTNY